MADFSYSQLSLKEFHDDGYSVRALRLEDILDIKQWRNEQMAVLRQKTVLTDEDQRRYYRQVIAPSFEQEYPGLMLFSYFLEGRLIGYGGLTNLDWDHRRAEISYLVETARSHEKDAGRYEEDFSHFLRLMKRIAFEELALNRLFTETFDIRPLHVSILEKNGFKPEGRLNQHVRLNGSYLDSLVHGCLKEFEHVEG
ncbi:MAG TPA: GNAT family N-acetyltransferase [Paenibacillus sp.]|uniref:GNAT family N-acetyltransferase n=1 Tax=Paenibacillus sp. TaxID=58172 RepID=UPI002CD2D6BA|nr:GNAT family N-acetyltransferase [Paenibacillus sp.]HUC91997.1 GNAT family N-acetyltransferase [Paenibacillus sp.]